MFFYRFTNTLLFSCYKVVPSLSLSPYAFFQETNPRNALFSNVSTTGNQGYGHCGCVSYFARYHSGSRISLYLFVT
jgi:hypothetical protein